MPLKQTIEALSNQFAVNLLSAMRNASIEEILGMTGGGRARTTGVRRRRSAGDLEQTVSSVVTLLKKHPKGLRAEEIRANLGIEQKDLPKPMRTALEQGLIRKKGQKRATVYFTK